MLATLLIGSTSAPVLARDAGSLAPMPALTLTHAETAGPFGHLFTDDSQEWVPLSTSALEGLVLDLTPSWIEIDPRAIRRLEGQGVQAQKPPEPSSTGFKALLVETARDFVAFPQRPSTWVILGIGGAGAALAHPIDDEVNEKLVGSDAVGTFFAPGKYIGAVYTQAGVAVGLYVIGRYVLPHEDGAPKTNRVSHLGFDMLRAIIVSQALTQGIKEAVRRDRPTGECCAFPSGHSSITFATASVLERHFGYRGSWPMFLVASYVAASRLHDNRHYLSDVIFGAALGVSTGWTVVGRHGRSNFALTPVPVKGGMMVALTHHAPAAANP